MNYDARIDINDSVQSVIDRINADVFDFAQLIRLSESGNELIRINAIEKIASRHAGLPAVEHFDRIALLPYNRQHFFGRTVTVLIIAALLTMRRDDAASVAKRIAAALPESELMDLRFHLKSAGIDTRSI